MQYTTYPARAIKQRDHLYESERRVVAKVLEGKRNKIIAAELGLTEGTVKEYLFAAYKILGVQSRCELMAMYLRPMSSDGSAPEHT